MASTSNLKMRVNASIVIMKILISMIYHIILIGSSYTAKRNKKFSWRLDVYVEVLKFLENLQ